LRKLGALSDRELSFNELQDMQSEKEGLRLLQAAVAWGAWKERSFLHRISRELIYDSQIDFTKHEEILEFSNLANRHRDNLYRYIIRNAEVLQISPNPRILAVFCLNRNDFGKARGTIAGHLAGEWSSVILLITKDDSGQNYNISIRNHYKMKVDLEKLGQLALAESAGGSKGAYRITLKKDKLISFIIAIQQWAYSLNPRWVRT
jgi:Cu/Ag efflux pump CusA